jgi:hypothetical protein
LGQWGLAGLVQVEQAIDRVEVGRPTVSGARLRSRSQQLNGVQTRFTCGVKLGLDIREERDAPPSPSRYSGLLVVFG